MSKLFQKYKHLFLCAALVLSFSTGQSVFSQHEGHSMKGMSKPKPKLKRKAGQRKKRTGVKKHQPVKKQEKGGMSGMDMPGMNMPATPAPPSQPESTGASESKPSPSTHTHMPGMNMPATPAPGSLGAAESTPTTSTHADMAGMNMPTTPTSPDEHKPGSATHTHMPGMKMPQSAPGEKPSATDDMKGMDTSSNMGPMNMGPLMVMNGNDMGIRVGSSDSNIMSMGQMASGTSWQPASTPLHMIHRVMGNWLVMFHYNAIVGFNSQGGPRGVTKLESQNWFMAMAYHKLGKGTLQLRSMFSLEPFTFPPGGAPLLFQTGETYKGQPLIDKQHPHDLFMELSATYTVPIGERATWFAYVGYPGEPALGPAAFMHRWSASENPSAPLSHHEQDSSHISFGVLTSGFTYRWLKLEGSIFNGREPDENRYNFEYNPWNARSFRVTVAPTKNLSAQWSYGTLKNRELFEHVDTGRMTASIHYNKVREHGNWATSLIWGRNHDSILGEGNFNLNGYTAESTVNFRDKNYLYTRLELVDKNELLRPIDRLRLGITDDHPSFRIGAYTFGGARDVMTNEKMSVAIGSDLTFYSKPAVLDLLYGSNPVSWKLFLRLRPAKMKMDSMHSGH